MATGPDIRAGKVEGGDWAMVLSALDRKIIVELQKDGRKSFSELAKELGVSISTLRRKVNALVENEVITITAIPNPKKVGYDIVAILGISVNRKNILTVLNQICEAKYNHLVGITTGRFDIIAWSLFKNTNELSDYLINVISKIEGVIRTETLLILEFSKRTFGWIEAEDSIDLSKDRSNVKAKTSG